MKVYFFNFLIFFFAYSFLYAQVNKDDTLHKECKHSHENLKNELGVSNSMVYLMNEKSICYGIHLHFVRNIKKSKFGLGLGYERIFDDHKHNTLGLIASYNPIHELTFAISPGLMTEDKHFEELRFALHLETAYEFEIKNVCFGPALEIAIHSNDLHLSLGFHLGLSF